MEMDNIVAMCGLACNEYIAYVASQKNDYDLSFLVHLCRKGYSELSLLRVRKLRFLQLELDSAPDRQ